MASIMIPTTKLSQSWHVRTNNFSISMYSYLRDLGGYTVNLYGVGAKPPKKFMPIVRKATGTTRQKNDGGKFE